MRRIVVFILVSLFLLKGVTFADQDWVHNWINNTIANYSGPSYFDSGKRGYVSFGSFSLRQPVVIDQLVAFQLPSIRVGCGGIDLFGGGFHFMDFDYLATQFQNIISAAPAFAFEYALRAISEQTGTIMDSLKSIVDVLNQIQYNSCAMSRQLGYWMASSGDDAYRAIGQGLKDAFPEMKFLSDQNNFFYKILKNLSDVADGRITNAEGQQLNQDCPTDFMNILQKGSLVKYIHDTYFPGSENDSLESLIRGYVGDVLFEQKDGLWKAHYQPPCGGQNEESFTAFVEGTAMGMNLGSTWVPTDGLPVANCVALYSSSSGTIMDSVDTALQNAYSSLENNTALSSTDVQWLQIMPLPILRYLKQLYMYQAPSSAVMAISTPAAYGVGFSMLSLVYGETAKAIKFILDKRINACPTKVAADKLCYLCQQDRTVIESLKAFQESLQERQEQAWQKWQQVKGDIAKAQKLLVVLQDTSQEAIRAKLATGSESF